MHAEKINSARVAKQNIKKENNLSLEISVFQLCHHTIVIAIKMLGSQLKKNHKPMNSQDSIYKLVLVKGNYIQIFVINCLFQTPIAVTYYKNCETTGKNSVNEVQTVCNDMIKDT